MSLARFAFSLLVAVDRGILGVTNMGIYFGGSIRTFRVAYKKIAEFKLGTIVICAVAVGVFLWIVKAIAGK